MVFFFHVVMCIQDCEKRFCPFQKKTKDEDMKTIYAVCNTVGKGIKFSLSAAPHKEPVCSYHILNTVWFQFPLIPFEVLYIP